MKFHCFLLAAVSFLGVLGHTLAGSDAIKIQGSPVIAHVMISAAPILSDDGIDIKVAVEGSSGTAAATLGKEEVDIAMMMRHLTAEERAAYPNRPFQEYQIGMQIIALIVPRDVWMSGVHSLTREQVAGIYEGKITNWKDVGGANQAIKFYNSERGRGVWELFATWLYGETRKAPYGKFPIIVDGEDARNSIHFTPGSMSMASIRWVDNKETFGIAIKEGDGPPIEPTAANVAAGKYLMARPAFLIVGDKPVGTKKKVIDFFLGPQGQDLVKKSDIIPLADFAAPK
jgi:phosphate transport system substrate-binding protein